MLRQTIRMTAASKVSSPSNVAMNRIRMVNNWLGARVNVRIPSVLFSWQLRELRDKAGLFLKQKENLGRRSRSRSQGTGASTFWRTFYYSRTHKGFRDYSQGFNTQLWRINRHRAWTTHLAFSAWS
jgi:hypothetical protein